MGREIGWDEEAGKGGWDKRGQNMKSKKGNRRERKLGSQECI